MHIMLGKFPFVRVLLQTLFSIGKTKLNSFGQESLPPNEKEADNGRERGGNRLANNTSHFVSE